MSYSGWTDKLEHQTMGCYSVLEGNELSRHEEAWRKLKCMLLSERSQSEKATYYMIPTIWHSGKGKTMATVKRSMVASGQKGKKGWIGRAQRIFKAAKILLWYYNAGYLSLYILSKPIECRTTRINPNVNSRLRVIMMHQCRFISSNKCTALVGNVDNGGGGACVRAGGT